MFSEKKFRVSEIFGPTIQGEGRHAGIPCYFIRIGGCDYRCTWCDTPFAVLPEEVAKLNQMTPDEILQAVIDLPTGPQWVVLSGGNPALFDLEEVIDLLHVSDFKVMTETQGSIWKDWLIKCDEVCISPKPPSSGTKGYDPNFLLEGEKYGRFYLKVVVFDDVDYYWARNLRSLYPKFDFFLSVGNEDPSLPTVSNPHPDQISTGSITLTRKAVLDKTRWLFEKVASDEDMANVRVTPQLHTLAWGNIRGR